MSSLTSTLATGLDYADQIKGEIEAAVAELIERVKTYTPGEYWYPIDPIEPEYIELGYLINMHRGRDLYREGDLIHGVPVRIDRQDGIRSISVCADEVQFEWDREEYLYDRDGWEDEEAEQSRYDEYDIRETITW